MIAMSGDAAFLLLWIDFTVLALTAVTAAVIWGVRAGQFRNQDSARYLPLRSGIPETAESKQDAWHDSEAGKIKAPDR
jgi:hypothetical protein